MGSLTVRVRDDEGNPVARARVHCTFHGTLGLKTRSDQETDDDGTAYFEDVPVGRVTVRADGSDTELGVGINDDEEVTPHRLTQLLMLVPLGADREWRDSGSSSAVLTAAGRTGR